MRQASSVVFALLLAGGIAHADPANDAKADAALAEGRRLYDIQNWDQAIAKFKEAYTLRPDPASLFNIAQSQRLKNDCPNALQSYRAYKRNYPTAKNIAKVDKFIAEMEACVASSVKPPPAEPEPTPPPTPETTPPPVTEPAKPVPPPPPAAAKSGSGMKWAGLAVGVAGLASVGVGVKFALDGKGYSDDLKTVCATSCTSEQALSIEDKGNSANTKAMVFSAIGGGLVVTGAVLFVLSLRGDHTEQPSVAVVPTQGGATASYSFSF